MTAQKQLRIAKGNKIENYNGTKEENTKRNRNETEAIVENEKEKRELYSDSLDPYGGPCGLRCFGHQRCLKNEKKTYIKIRVWLLRGRGRCLKCVCERERLLRLCVCA